MFKKKKEREGKEMENSSLYFMLSIKFYQIYKAKWKSMNSSSRCSNNNRTTFKYIHDEDVDIDDEKKEKM